MSNDRRKVKSVQFNVGNPIYVANNIVEITFDEDNLPYKRLLDQDIKGIFSINGNYIIDEDSIEYSYSEENDNHKIIENIVRAIFRSESFKNVVIDDWRFRMDKESLKTIFSISLNNHFNGITIKDYYICNTIMKNLFRLFILSEKELYIYYLTPDYKGTLKESLHVYNELDILWVNHSSLKDLNIINIHIDVNSNNDSFNFQFTYLDGDKKAEDFITRLNSIVSINSEI